MRPRANKRARQAAVIAPASAANIAAPSVLPCAGSQARSGWGIMPRTRRFALTVSGQHKETVIVQVEGVGDRDAAEALRGTRFYVPRSALPEPDDGAFYHADLIGLAVVTVSGETLGRVTAMHDFGAGDLIEYVSADGVSRMLPFTEATVPEVDLAGGRLVVDPPEGLTE